MPGFAEEYIRGHEAGMQAKLQADDLEGRKIKRAQEAEILKHTLAKYKADESMDAVTGPLKIEQMRSQLLQSLVGTGAEMTPQQRTFDSSVAGGPVTLPSAAETRTAATASKVNEAKQLDALKNVDINDPALAQALNLTPGSYDPAALTAATSVAGHRMSAKATTDAASIAAKSRADAASSKPEKLIRVEHKDPETGRAVVSWLPQSAVAGQSFEKPTNATTENRLASAQAVIQTGDSIVAKLKDPNFASVVGPALGKFNSLRDFIGNPPPEFSELAGNIESYALANMGVHGMRNAQGAEKINAMLDKRHTPDSLAATIKGLNEFGANMMRNEGRKATGAAAPTAAGGAGGALKIGKYDVTVSQ